MQIVVAWADKTKLVPTGRHVRRDLNWFPEFRTELEGKACMWANKGTDADLVKARDYAEKEGLLVLTFDASEKDPLAAAREAAVTKKHERKSA
jgi:hypothetical protein